MDNKAVNLTKVSPKMALKISFWYKNIFFFLVHFTFTLLNFLGWYLHAKNNFSLIIHIEFSYNPVLLGSSCGQNKFRFYRRMLFSVLILILNLSSLRSEVWKMNFPTRWVFPFLLKSINDLISGQSSTWCIYTLY